MMRASLMSRAGASRALLLALSLSAFTIVAGVPAVALAATTAPALTQAEAAHFLDHSSFGPTAASIADVQKLGVARYIEEQFAVPATGYHGYAYLTSDRNVGCPTGAAWGPACSRA